MRTNVTQQCHLSLSENGKRQICFPRVRRWSPRRCRITLQMSLMSAKQHPRETKSGLNVTQQCHLSLSENGKWQICFPRVRRWSPRRCRITLQNVAYECQTTPSGNEKRTNVTQQCHLSLSENGKRQICFPRVRRWSPRRCRITLQNVAYECQTTPSGNEKRTKRFPRVQNKLLRSKRGQKCYP